jgi:hypothetical protein
LEGIPWNEITDVDELDETESEKPYYLNVYKEILTK